MTKAETAKAIVFACTEGKRKPENWIAGMYLIDIIASRNYAWALKSWHESIQNGESKRLIWGRVIDITYTNTFGVNGATNTSRAFMAAARNF